MNGVGVILQESRNTMRLLIATRCSREGVDTVGPSLELAGELRGVKGMRSFLRPSFVANEQHRKIVARMA